VNGGHNAQQQQPQLFQQQPSFNGMAVQRPLQSYVPGGGTLPRFQQHHQPLAVYNPHQFNPLHYVDGANMPKAPLKGILKNPNALGGGSTGHLVEDDPNDVSPFDSVPPCDDCLERARDGGTFPSIGACPKSECGLSKRGQMRQLRQRRPPPLKRRGSTRSLSGLMISHHQQCDPVAQFPLGSRESLLGAAASEDNVESSV